MGCFLLQEWLADLEGQQFAMQMVTVVPVVFE